MAVAFLNIQYITSKYNYRGDFVKKLIAILLAGMMCAGCVLSGCSSDSSSSSSDAEKTTESSKSDYENNKDPMEGLAVTRSEDKYRNFYQIFVNSFCDSDGDNVGDLKGIISKLDYLNDGKDGEGDDLEVDGLWMTPIMPSKSYHKYDVEDYYDIDEAFGTLDDFDTLLSECHKRGINVIIDLVLNHSSTENPLYIKACNEVAEGKLDGYAEYYDIHEADYYDSSIQVNTLANGYVCEANFSHDMPEWNLNSDKTREEFKKIAKFWIDRGVDGFRLDATKYYTNKHTDGNEFLKWFYSSCKDMKNDIYMVAENWTEPNDIEAQYKSGIDSQFAFKFAQVSGDIVKCMNTSAGQSLISKINNYDKMMKAVNPEYINAMFLSNHDQARIGNALENKGTDWSKFAASVYMLLPGNPFIYYGEEIGMTAPKTTNDSFYRTGMVFDSDSMPEIVVNWAECPSTKPNGGGVKQQLADKDSLLNFYKRVIQVKRQNPELARGTMTKYEGFDNSAIGAYYVDYNGSKLMVIHNFSPTDEIELNITDDVLSNAQLRADLYAGGKSNEHLQLKDGKLKMPAHSSVVLKSGE